MNLINTHWASIGGVIGVIIIAYQFLNQPNFNELQPWFWIHVALLMFHQYEEYIYPGGFKEFFNTILQSIHLIKKPLNFKSVFIVNVLYGWTAYTAAALFGEKTLWFAFGLLIITLVNGLFHTVFLLYRRKYNPGAITSLFLLLPFSVFILFKFSSKLTDTDIIYALIVSIIGLLLILITINIIKKER